MKEAFYDEQFINMAKFYHNEVVLLKDELHMFEERVVEMQRKCSGPDAPWVNKTAPSALLPFSSERISLEPSQCPQRVMK